MWQIITLTGRNHQILKHNNGTLTICAIRLQVYSGLNLDYRLVAQFIYTISRNYHSPSAKLMQDLPLNTDVALHCLMVMLQVYKGGGCCVFQDHACGKSKKACHLLMAVDECTQLRMIVK